MDGWTGRWMDRWVGGGETDGGTAWRVNVHQACGGRSKLQLQRLTVTPEAADWAGAGAGGWAPPHGPHHLLLLVLQLKETLVSLAP